MAVRNIVKIDEDKCDGCGLCAKACAEGAIEIVDGKAKLVSEIYCDGLGACIGHCPQGAITVERREAPEFDEAATERHLAAKDKAAAPAEFVCPGIAAQELKPERKAGSVAEGPSASELGQWPVQLNLVPPAARYFQNSDLVLVADCVPFAMADFHARFLRGRSVAVGCPKLDDTEFYIEKLAAILQVNDLRSLTVVHMEVPCCSGLTHIAKEAIAQSEMEMSFEDVTVSLKGEVVQTKTIEV